MTWQIHLHTYMSMYVSKYVSTYVSELFVNLPKFHMLSSKSLFSMILWVCILPLLNLFQPFGFLQIEWHSYWKNKISTYLHPLKFPNHYSWGPWAFRLMKERFLESGLSGPSGPYLGGPFQIKKSRAFSSSISTRLSSHWLSVSNSCVYWASH